MEGRDKRKDQAPAEGDEDAAPDGLEEWLELMDEIRLDLN